MKRYLGLASWFVLLTVISGYLTASACNLIYGPNSGRVVSNEQVVYFHQTVRNIVSSTSAISVVRAHTIPSALALTTAKCTQAVLGIRVYNRLQKWSCMP